MEGAINLYLTQAMLEGLTFKEEIIFTTTRILFGRELKEQRHPKQMKS